MKLHGPTYHQFFQLQVYSGLKILKIVSIWYSIEGPSLENELTSCQYADNVDMIFLCNLIYFKQIIANVSLVSISET